MPEYYTVLTAFASFLVGLRLLSRFMRVGGRFGVDDFFIVIAWLISIPAGVLSVIGAYVLLWRTFVDHSSASQNYGLNRHIWDVPSYEWEDGAKVRPNAPCRALR
jgi:predicted oxidoreductase